MRLDTKPLRITVTVLSVLLGLMFVAGGIPKLLGAPEAVAGFAKYGYPDWFRLLIGALETGAGVLLFVPRLAWAGAATLVVVMAGAAYTHAFRAADEGHLIPFPLVLLAVAAFIAYARWNTARAPATSVSRGLATVR